MADGTKSTGGDSAAQPRAAANAAAFAIRLTEELITEREHMVMPKSSVPDNGDTVHNFSSGQVGIQAGHVTGSTVQMGPASQATNPAGLSAELAAFRDMLVEERSAGRIDEATYEAAQAELEIAAEALAVNTEAGRNTFIVALKRLRGLIADVTDLATRIAALLGMAKRLL
jgi:adenosylhomocysteine nucleosidase